MTDPMRYGDWHAFVTPHTGTYPAISPERADLGGRSVFISGASKGVGRTTALRFAMAGCSHIAVAARSPLAPLEREIKEAAARAGRAEPQVLALELDVTSPAGVEAAAAQVGRAFGGRLDLLINNAGYLERWRPVAESDADEWWRAWEVNVRGTHLCTKHLLPLVLASELRTVVNVSSGGANMLADGASAYQTTKFALCRLTEFVAQEHEAEGLVTFAVHPGGVKTELALRMPENMYHHLVNEPELAADFLVWVAKERRPWLGARLINCLWDVEELEARKDEVVERDLFKFRLTL